jgi:uncharacterized protein (TIGR02145 family)
MAENLNIDAESSQCYGNDPANCTKYGRMYDWETALTVCPSGWHLPTDAEWTELTTYVESDGNCSDCAGAKLKTNRGWADNGEGTDNYGFSALPGGEGGEEDVGFRNDFSILRIWKKRTLFWLTLPKRAKSVLLEFLPAYFALFSR